VLGKVKGKIASVVSQSIGVGRMFESVCLFVCLFVCPQHNSKRKIPKCPNLLYGMTLGYPRSDMVLG